MAGTVTVTPAEAKTPALPLPIESPEQLPAKILTVEPGSALPFTATVLSEAGGSGSVSVIAGAFGGEVSGGAIPAMKTSPFDVRQLLDSLRSLTFFSASAQASSR